MSQIPITKKDKFSPEEIARGLETDPRRGQRQEELRPSSRWPFLSIILILIIIASGVNYWFLVSQKHVFTDLIPDEATAYALINQVDFYPQAASFSRGAVDKLNQYFNQAGLDFSNDILPLFKSKMALIALPANSEVSLPWLIILKKRVNLAEISRILDKIRLEMNKDFNISTKDYRQVSIILLNSILNPSAQYFYALMEDYLIISNSQESIQEIVDAVIGG